MHKKSADIVQRSFRSDADFVASLDRACTEFVNNNAVTEISTSKATELLATYADALLRQNNELVEENGFEQAVNKVVSNAVLQHRFVSFLWLEVLRWLCF